MRFDASALVTSPGGSSPASRASVSRYDAWAPVIGSSPVTQSSGSFCVPRSRVSSLLMATTCPAAGPAKRTFAWLPAPRPQDCNCSPGEPALDAAARGGGGAEMEDLADGALP